MLLLPPVLAVGLLAALMGVIVLRRGLRGRPVDDHPVCARCAFDLVGVYPGAAACPECGSPLAAGAEGREPVRIGNRPRRPRMIALGATLLALGLFLSAAMVVAASGTFRWHTLAPTWLLKMELSNSTSGDAAMTELLARLNAKKLSVAQAAAIADAAMDRQGNSAAAWSPTWGDFIEGAWTAGHLSRVQVSRYIRQAAPLVFSGRARTEVGANWPYSLKIGPGRCGSTTAMSIGSKLESFMIGDKPVPASYGSGITELGGNGWSSSGGWIPLGDLAPGTYKMVARLSLFGRRGKRTITAPPDATWDSELAIMLEIVPVGRDMVELVSDPALRQTVVSSIRVQQLELIGDRVDGVIIFDVMPVAAAFDVFWRVADASGEPAHEYAMGSVSTSTADGMRHPTSFTGTLPAGVAPKKVDVVLRPSPAAARVTTDITRIWGEEIVLPNVPVTVRDQPDPAPSK